MSKAIDWTVAQILGKKLPAPVANLPRTVHKKK